MSATRYFIFFAVMPAAVAFVRLPARAATQAEHLDHSGFNGEYKVDVSPDDDARRNHAREFHDTLVFHGDQFLSRELEKHGFEQAHYDEDTRRDGPSQFTAKCHSKDEGDAVWQGARDADQFTGTLVWTKPNGDVLNYTFQSEQ